jgi:hypothetical protein
MCVNEKRAVNTRKQFYVQKKRRTCTLQGSIFEARRQCNMCDVICKWSMRAWKACAWGTLDYNYIYNSVLDALRPRALCTPVFLGSLTR